MATPATQFRNELVNAVSRHGDEHVDIMVTDGQVYGFFHSVQNSFSVTETYSLEDLGGKEVLKQYEDDFEHLCICED